MVIWVANVTSFDHQTLMDMPFHELEKWYESVMEFREHRLEEEVNIMKEAFSSASESEGQGMNMRNVPSKEY